MTSISDEIAKAGAEILDPLLSSDCPLKVARQVLEAAHGIKAEQAESNIRSPWAGATLKQPVVF